MTEVVITGAARTPVGAFLGGLSSLPASKLGEAFPEAVLREAMPEMDPVDTGQVTLDRYCLLYTSPSPRDS